MVTPTETFCRTGHQLLLCANDTIISYSSFSVCFVSDFSEINTSTSDMPWTPVSLAYDPEYSKAFSCSPAQERSGPATVAPNCSAGDVLPRGTAYFARMLSTYSSAVKVIVL